jgi:hypothetical protein
LEQEHLDAPPECPEGTQELIERMHRSSEKIGTDESEWSDDPTSIADWETLIQTIEPLEFTAAESERMAAFYQHMRRHNVDAVRRLMEEGTDE